MAVNSKLLDLPIAEANKQITATLGAALKLGTDVRFVGSGSLRYAERRLSNGTWKDLRQYRLGASSSTTPRLLASTQAGSWFSKDIFQEPNRMPKFLNTNIWNPLKFVAYFTERGVPYDGDTTINISHNTLPFTASVNVPKYSVTIENDPDIGQHVKIVRALVQCVPMIDRNLTLEELNKVRCTKFSFVFPSGVIPPEVDFVRVCATKHHYKFDYKQERTSGSVPSWANRARLIGNVYRTPETGRNNREVYFGMYTWHSAVLEEIPVFNGRVESSTVVSFESEAENWWKKWADLQHIVWWFFIEVRSKAVSGVWRNPRETPVVEPFTTRANLSDHSKEILWNI